MNRHHPPFRLGIFGASGCGKTTWLLRWLRSAKYSARFVFDPEGEIAAALGSYGASSPAQMAEQLRQGWCIFDPGPMFGGDWPRAFDFFCRFAFETSAATPGKKVFVCDEIWRCVRTNELPPSVATLVFTGRRQSLDFVVVGQMPNRVHNAILDGLTEVVCFRLMHDRALEFPACYGFDAEALRTLPQFECIRRTNTGAETRGRGKVAN